MSQGALVSYIVLGVLAGATFVAFLAFRRGFFGDSERPKYEMLGMSPQDVAEAPASSGGRANEGVEDRIVRLALAVVAFYYALARFEMPSPGAIVCLAIGLYLALTTASGFDPVYRLLHWDTRLPEHRRRP